MPHFKRAAVYEEQKRTGKWGQLVEETKDMSFSQRAYYGIFSSGEGLLGVIKSNEEEVSKLFENLIEDVKQSILPNQDYFSEKVFDSVIDGVFRKGISLEEISTSISEDYLFVQSHLARFFRGARFPGRCMKIRDYVVAKSI